MGKVRVAVSRCILGERVRYDGRVKNYPLVLEHLSRHFELVGVCPEVEAGLSVPRPPAHIEGSCLEPHFVDHTSGRDHTFRIMEWGRQRLARFRSVPVHGYVFKSGSPSCAAVRLIPVFDAAGNIIGRSRGVFAHAFTQEFPGVPVADELELANEANLEEFVRRVKEARRMRRC